MLSKSDIVEKILSQIPDISGEELREMVRRKMESAGDLLTEEGATYMVASELGIDLSKGNVAGTGLRIEDLVIGANDVSIVASVLAISPIKKFTRSDGVEGRVARLVVSDDTGSMNAVLWNEKTEIVASAEISPNQVVRISHGYVREGLNGSPELNLGRRGTIIPLSSDPPSSLTESAGYFKKIRDLEDGDSFVNLFGVVKGFSRVSRFRRRDGGQGRVMRVRLGDETGRIMAVFWDEKVDSVKECRRDDVLEITGGRVRRGLGKALEVHVGGLGRVRKIEETEMEISSSLDITEITDLRSEMSDVDVLGRVVDMGSIREFERRSGSVGKVGSLYLRDEGGSVRLNLWDDKTDALTSISPGEVVLVEGGYTRRGLGDALELNLSGMGKLTVNPAIEEAESLPTSVLGVTHIDELRVGMRNIVVEGLIVEEANVRDVTTRLGEDIRVASLKLRDESGEISVTLWRDLADQLDGVPEGSLLQVKNGYVKMGFYGGLELSSTSMTKVKVSGGGELGEASNLVEDQFDDGVSELMGGDRVEVYGRIVDLTPNSRVYPSCPNCGKRVRNEGGVWFCEKCGATFKPSPVLSVEAIVEKEGREVMIVFLGGLAEKLLGITADQAWNISVRKGSDAAPVDACRSKIINSQIQVVARVGSSGNRRDGVLRLIAERLVLAS